MKTIAIYTKDTRKVIYEGLFPSYKSCLESAIQNGIKLERADLRHKNLSNAAMDGAYMPDADFTQANLSGANISEACLLNACFIGTSFYNACLADSDLKYCDFEAASFGATYIGGSDISHSCFSTLSCFTLDFDTVRNMQACVFKNPNGTLSRMSKPPLVIKGGTLNPIVLMDEHMKIGTLTIPYIPKTIAFGTSWNRSEKKILENAQILIQL